MKSKLSTLYFILWGMLFICIGLFPLYGEDPDQHQSGVQYFTGNILVELVRHGNSENITREEIEELSRNLSDFFTNFKYNRLSETMFSLVGRDDNYRLIPEMLRAVEWLEKYKEGLFSSIQIDPEQYYEFISDSTYSFVSFSVDTSRLDLKPEQVEFMLMVLAVGMTADGPFYLENEEYTLQGISVDWLMAGQFMSGMIGGAPGGYPIKPPGMVVAQAYAMDDSSISSSSTSVPLPAYQKEFEKPRRLKNEVDVFILDTVPVITDIYEGYMAYNATNDLVDTILSALGTDHTIQYDNGTDPGFHTYMNEHYGNGNLSDHGLFIAGTIHLLSPDTNIHLIEVMNKYGIGTLDSVLWGLHEALNQADSGEPFIVNASLTTKLRFPERENKFNEEITDLRVKMVYGLTTPDIHLSLLRNAIELITLHNGVVIAAAGNDSDVKYHRDPGYPAAFDTVIGVGSVQRNGLISSFSNEPGPGGFMAFGGEVDATHTTKDGILSIYLSSAYADSAAANTSGWAIWAGSSFASGVVSGTMASLLEQGYTITLAKDILKASSFSSGGYEVIPVKQGP